MSTCFSLNSLKKNSTRISWQIRSSPSTPAKRCPRPSTEAGGSWKLSSSCRQRSESRLPSRCCRLCGKSTSWMLKRSAEEKSLACSAKPMKNRFCWLLQKKTCGFGRCVPAWGRKKSKTLCKSPTSWPRRFRPLETSSRIQFPLCINGQTRYLLRGRTEGRRLCVTSILSIYWGIALAKVSVLTPLPWIKVTVWQVIRMLLEKGGIMWATT